MIGKWDRWYADLDAENPSAFRYGDTETYKIAADFLADCAEVEDWGCGAGGFKRFCKTRYIGVDGSHTPFADKQVDLRYYKSSAEGVLLRHVLEHNYDWRMVLGNALETATKKLCLILFTPAQPVTQEIAHNAAHGVDVPDLGFFLPDIERCFEQCAWSYHMLKTDTGYGMEHVYKIWK